MWERLGRVCEACTVCSQTRREAGRGKGTAFTGQRLQAWLGAACLSSLPTLHTSSSSNPAPFPCTLCLDWEGNERKSRTHSCLFSKICLRSRKRLQLTPGRVAALLAPDQILPHRHQNTSRAKSTSVTQRIICSRGKNTLHRIHLPVTQPSTDSRSQKARGCMQGSKAPGTQALGSPRLGAT